MATPNITEKIPRSLTLLRAFILASALLLAAAAIGLGVMLTHALRQQAVEDAQLSLTEYTNGLLHREIVHGGRISVGYRAKEIVKTSLAARPDILSVQVWLPDGVLAWTNVAPERMGKAFPVSNDLRDVIETRKAVHISWSAIPRSTRPRPGRARPKPWRCTPPSSTAGT